MARVTRFLLLKPMCQVFRSKCPAKYESVFGFPIVEPGNPISASRDVPLCVLILKQGNCPYTFYMSCLSVRNSAGIKNRTHSSKFIKRRVCGQGYANITLPGFCLHIRAPVSSYFEKAEIKTRI